jgi:hypothetical protein
MDTKNLTTRKIGIVDQPNREFAKDTLKTKSHADALTSFIEGCDTPITIGIQGEWGSGKTSLLNLINENLKNSHNEGKFLQIWINAWEHSLLSKPEETLLKIVNEIINKMVIHQDKSKELKDKFRQNFEILAKGALRVATAATLGDDAKEVVDEILGNDSNVISKMKKQLETVAKDINASKKGSAEKIERIVIYVDDLDRIDPPDAVAILELLKNIFNVEHCIFVLAIDYQVIVKGLKAKFGEPTDENEWEFRAFFDKIIQLPFMMPVGQYDIGNYVSDLLIQIGFLQRGQEDEDKFDKQVTQVITQVVRWSIGGNPRALKRLINSLSLIEIFRKLKEDDSDEQSEEYNLTETQEDMLMFAIMCIQIKYPDIYDVIIRFPDFKKWDDKIAVEITDRKENGMKNFESDFTDAKARDEFDEPWEEVLYRICYIKPRFRRRADDISNLLSYIDSTILFGETTSEAIDYIARQTLVTSISSTDDLKTDVKQKWHKVTYYEGLATYIDYVKENQKSDYDEKVSEDLIDIDKLINEYFKEKISSGEINSIYTKTGGLSLNYRNERQIKQGMGGTKFFQIRFGKTDEFLIKDKLRLPSFKNYGITKSKYINAYTLKTTPDYKDNKIGELFPAQSLHAHHFYSFKLKSVDDFQLFLKSGFLRESFEMCKKGKIIKQANNYSKLKLKKIYCSDIIFHLENNHKI